MYEHIPHYPRAVMLAQGELAATWIHLGALYNASNETNAVHHPDMLKHLLSGMGIIYQFATIEEHLNTNDGTWERFLAAIPSEGRDKLLAFKHVRHSAAHGANKKRAQQCREPFERVMRRANTAERIQSVTHWDEDTLELSNFAALECHRFLDDLFRTEAQRGLNDRSAEE